MAQEVVATLERIERKLDLVVSLLRSEQKQRDVRRVRMLRRQLQLMAETMEMADDDPPPFLPPED